MVKFSVLQYLADLIKKHSPVRKLRSSHNLNLLEEPKYTGEKFGSKSFCVAGPRFWNRLPAEQQVQYCLIKLLNEDREAEEIIHNIQNQNFCKFKSSLKYKIIASYSDKCVIIDCHTCKIIAENG